MKIPPLFGEPHSAPLGSSANLGIDAKAVASIASAAARAEARRGDQAKVQLGSR